MLSTFVGAGAVQARSWTAEQSAVWKAVSATWEKDLNKDDGWMTRDPPGGAGMVK